MTFFEAAVEVLRQSGRPLHYKKITELAISQSLLSHIGKTPEVTMEARLNQEADKAGSTTIRRVRPGVYALLEGFEAVTVRETVQPEAAPLPSPAPPPELASVAAAVAASAPEPWTTAEAAPDSTEGRSRRRRRSRGLAELDPSLPRLSTGPAPAAAVRLPEAAPPAGEAGRSAGIADDLHALLEAAAGPLRLPDLARQLEGPGRATSVATLEQVMLAENRRRLEAGQPPRFARLGPAWTITGRALARPLHEALDALERARAAVAAQSVRDLGRAVAQLGGPDLEAFSLAVLEGLDFTTRALERTAESSTFEALTGASSLLPLKALVCVWHGARPVGADEVAALRGRLHRFGATHGVLVAVGSGRMADAARAEAAGSTALPIVLLDADGLAPLALRAGVGVTQAAVRIALPDPAWFPPNAR